jgi:ABC-type polysaccharide/polyol phosphate transport system ATPase subunit
MSASDYAIKVEDCGIRFVIRHQKSPTVHSGLVRFLKKKPSAEPFWALRNVSFEVPRGRVFGIIGANGSGKSTMLRTLARIYSPDEGTVRLRGKVSSLISLGAGFNANLSGEQNIFYNGLLLGLSRQEIERKFQAIKDFAELGDFIDAPVRTYSSGMRARLGFSVAVHVEPEILVVDEVLVVGDAAFRQKCQDKMTELFRGGTTVVMVQHNLDAIVSMCHEAMWLEKGAVREIGVPLEVVNHYLRSRGLDPMEPRENGAPAVAGEAS